MTDPLRLLDDPDTLSPEERRVLIAGKNVEPPSHLRRAVWLGLASQLKGSAAAATVTASSAGNTAVTGAGAGALGAAAAGGSSLTLVTAKWFAMGALIGATGLGAVEVVRRAEPAPSSASSTPAGHGEKTSSEAAPARTTSLPSEAEAHPEIPTPDAAIELPGPGPVGSAPADARGSALAPPSVARVSAAQRTNAANADSKSNHGADVAFDPFRDEAARVARARTLLRSGQTSAAQRELVQLTREYPEGVLLQEREALQVEAFVIDGQLQAARESATRFQRRYPNSPHGARIRSLIEE